MQHWVENGDGVDVVMLIRVEVEAVGNSSEICARDSRFARPGQCRVVIGL